MMKSIKYNCIPCRRRFRKFASQVMAPIPTDKLNPSPPFYICGIDLFGPFSIRGEVNKRTFVKGYGILFTCLVTRAVRLHRPGHRLFN